ncbi:hypothetical protein [Dyadobacter sp. CY323]|nr:hypothetical protein [Dyadobacter sp. CY323]
MPRKPTVMSVTRIVTTPENGIVHHGNEMRYAKSASQRFIR